MYSYAMNPTILEFPCIGTSSHVLQHPVHEYKVDNQGFVTGGVWIVTHIPTGERVYIGPGPVEVFLSPAPF